MRINVLNTFLNAMGGIQAVAANPAVGFSKAPTHSTQAGIVQSLANLAGVNRRFHATRFDEIDRRQDMITSPVEARLVAEGPIGKGGSILSKGARRIALADVMGESASLFSGGSYMNLYLSPADRHYWRTPYPGKFVSTRVNQGEASLPVFIGLESLFQRADLFPHAVRSNASIASVLETEEFPIGMIAVGSLCVNAIHVLYEEGTSYGKGDLAGYFNIGSSMLLVFPDHPIYPLINEGQKVSLGQAIAAIDHR